MIQVTPQMRILVAVEAVDGRKGIDSLARLCQERLETDPFSGCLFVFRSRRGTAVRILAYDGQGFWLAQKRLSKGRFRWWPEGLSVVSSWTALLDRLQLAEVPVQLVVGVLADAAGVEHDDVGLLQVVGADHAICREHRGDALGVVLVHLAPEGANQEPPHFSHRRTLSPDSASLGRGVAAVSRSGKWPVRLLRRHPGDLAEVTPVNQLTGHGFLVHVAFPAQP